MIIGTSGVALPVPRNRAVIGKATRLVNSSEKKNSLKKIFMGIRAKKISNHRMNLRTKDRRLTSF